MGILDNFHENDLIGKVTLLTQVEKKNQQEAIPELFEICKLIDPSDQALFMAESTLRTLLMENETQTVQGLLSESEKIKKICLQVVQRKKFKFAVPILLSWLSDAGPMNESEVFDILSALSSLMAPEALDLFKKNISHANPVISELSIETIGNYGDPTAVPLLSDIVRRSETSDNVQACDMTTACAIEALGKIKDQAAVTYLSSAIHHKNPNTRRVVHQTLVEIGGEVIPEISKYFDQNDVDVKIMAANILGQIGGKKSADSLVSAIDKGAANHPNILFAIYEALGNISSMKSMVCLSDGLKETDEMILIAVMTAIDKQVNPGVMDTLKKLLEAKTDQSNRLINAIVTAKALSIFEALYTDEKTGRSLVNAIAGTKNGDLIALFREKLKSIPLERALSDAQTLSTTITQTSTRRLLAVDDSKAMVLFYQSALSGMGYDIDTALNGLEAYQKIESGHTYDLVITDMNMPLMNGIELCLKIRSHDIMGSVPIVMATTESERSQSEKAEKAGVTRFITKPFSADDIKKAIQSIADRV